MKLRIKGNAIRYRLTKSDLAKMVEEGFVKETVEFIDDQLVYVLQRTSAGRLVADFKDNVLTVYMPATMVTALANTDKVGFENTHGKLNLLIEKDFVCIDNVTEDQSDNYPHPLVENNGNC
jgi:hypothetical protein